MHNASGQSVEERVLDLEVRLSFQDKLIHELDEVIRGLRDQLDRLTEEVQQLQSQASSTPFEDAPPPHW